MPKAKMSSPNGAHMAGNPYQKPGSSGSKEGKSIASNTIFKMNTDLGQHVLKNPGVAQAIVDKADLKQSDIVLEVGPGSGNLTVKILEKAKKCIAVELDPRMAAEVTKRVQGTPTSKRLDVVLGDVIKTTLPYFDVCISNTPYQISSPLVFKLLATTPSPRVCILMFQREFAMRLFARPGDKMYSRLSVNAQMWAKIDHILKVGRNNFKPPPQVDSSVVRIIPKTPRPSISYAEWDGLLRICFVRKNKTLRSSFLGTTSLMDLLERNYRTWCAQNNIKLNEDEENVAMELEDLNNKENQQETTWDGFDDSDQEMMDEDDDELPSFLLDEKQHDLKTQNGSNKRKYRGKVAEAVREKVRAVLEDKTQLGEKRARMCDQGDFLKLLWEFNQQGIHFG